MGPGPDEVPIALLTPDPPKNASPSLSRTLREA